MTGLAGRGSGLDFSDKIQAPCRPEWQGEHRPATQDASREDRAILSFTLLLAVLMAGVVLSLTHAEANASLLSILN
jgi:hypothetical protein